MKFKEFETRLEQLYTLNKYVFILSDEIDLEDHETEQYIWWEKSMQAIEAMIKSFEDELGVGNFFEYGEGIVESFISYRDNGGWVYYEKLENCLGTELRTPKQLFNAITQSKEKIKLDYISRNKNMLEYLNEPDINDVKKGEVKWMK